MPNCTSILDFVFTANDAQIWSARSEIVVEPGDFPDDASTSDHRPVLAWFDVPISGALPITQTPLVTDTPTPIPTALPTVTTANRDANLRAGPGTNTAIVGSVATGQALEIIGRNQAGDWYLLDNGAWIASFLVDGATENIAVVTSTPTSTPIPGPTEPTVTPTVTPTSPPTPTPTTGVDQPNVVIQSIFYDGDVPQVESDEYAVIANTGTASQNLAGWRLNADDEGQDF